MLAKNSHLLGATIDQIRGSLDPEEMKDVVVGLMFYRYVSEQQLDGLEIPNDNKFVEMEKSAAKGEFLTETLIKTLKKIQKGFRKGYDDIFNDINDTLDNLRARASLTDAVVAKVVEAIAGLDGVDVENVDDYLETQSVSVGRFAGEHYTPQSIRNVLSGVASTFEYSDLMDPTLGTASTMIAAGRPGITYMGQEINQKTARLAKMNMIMHGIQLDKIAVEVGDSLSNDKFASVKSDMIVSVPPLSLMWNSQSLEDDPRFSFGMPPRSKADFAFLQHNLYHLSPQGHALTVVADGVLFRLGKEGKIREAIVEGGYVSAVISLPERLLLNTTIPVSIIVFSKTPVDDVLFIDASREFVKERLYNTLTEEQVQRIVDVFKKRISTPKYSQVVGLDEIRSNDYNLNVSRYVDTFESAEAVDLDALNARLVQLEKTESEASGAFEVAKAKLTR